LEKQFQPLKAWTIAIVITLAEVAFAINMFKVPAAMVQISTAFELDAISSGYLMSVVGLVSFILSVPSGMVMQKVGPRRLAIILFVVNLLGTVLGIISISYIRSFPLLVFSRAIEGIAYGLLATTATAFVSAWFPIQRRGLPNAISTLYVSIGSLIILMTSTVIIPQTNLAAPTFAFVNAWYFSLISLGVMFIVALIFLKMPKPEDSFLVGHEEGEKPPLVDGFKSPTIWLLVVAFFSFNIVTAAFSIYYPEYLQNGLGFAYVQANQLTSICTAVTLIGGIVGGLALRKVPPRKRPIYLLAVSIPIPVVGALMYILPDASFALPYLIFYGLVMQLFGGAILTMAPEASYSYKTLSITMGLLMLGVNLAGCVGVITTSVFIVNGGYASVAIPNTILSLVGVGAVIGVIFTMKRRWAAIDATGEEIQ
jgi:MFS family permease